MRAARGGARCWLVYRKDSTSLGNRIAGLHIPSAKPGSKHGHLLASNQNYSLHVYNAVLACAILRWAEDSLQVSLPRQVEWLNSTLPTCSGGQLAQGCCSCLDPPWNYQRRLSNQNPSIQVLKRNISRDQEHLKRLAKYWRRWWHVHRFQWKVPS